MARTLESPPRSPGSEPVCLLTREWAASRAESPDRFLQQALSETPAENGIVYRLPRIPGMWERLEVFVREEGECCPFLAFSAGELEDEIVLTVIWPRGDE